MGGVCGLGRLFLRSRSEPKIVTAVGTGQAGYGGDGGPAIKARLNMPFDVALDAQGDIYVTDTFNHRDPEGRSHDGNDHDDRVATGQRASPATADRPFEPSSTSRTAL